MTSPRVQDQEGHTSSTPGDSSRRDEYDAVARRSNRRREALPGLMTRVWDAHKRVGPSSRKALRPSCHRRPASARARPAACGWCGQPLEPKARGGSRSGVRRPAGSGPGSMPGRRPPDFLHYGSSSGQSRFACPPRPPGGTGHLCSSNSPGRHTTDVPTSAIDRRPGNPSDPSSGTLGPFRMTRPARPFSVRRSPTDPEIAPLVSERRLSTRSADASWPGSRLADDGARFRPSRAPGGGRGGAPSRRPPGPPPPCQGQPPGGRARPPAAPARGPPGSRTRSHPTCDRSAG